MWCGEFLGGDSYSATYRFCVGNADTLFSNCVYNLLRSLYRKLSKSFIFTVDTIQCHQITCLPVRLEL